MAFRLGQILDPGLEGSMLEYGTEDYLMIHVADQATEMYD